MNEKQARRITLAKMVTMSYPEAVAYRDGLCELHRGMWEDLRAAFPAIGSGACGVTPDAVKLDPAYRSGKAKADELHMLVREANGYVAGKFKAEERFARRARYEARRTARFAPDTPSNW